MKTRLSPAGRVFVAYVLAITACAFATSALLGCDAEPEQLDAHRDAPVRTNPQQSAGITLTNGTAYDGKVAIFDLTQPDGVDCWLSGVDPVDLECTWAACDVTVSTTAAFPQPGTEIRIELLDPCGVAL